METEVRHEVKIGIRTIQEKLPRLLVCPGKDGASCQPVGSPVVARCSGSNTPALRPLFASP